MARDDPPFKLRFPGDMRERIAAAAKANNRSMNAEVIARLEQTFGAPVLLTKNYDKALEDAAYKALFDAFARLSKSDPASKIESIEVIINPRSAAKKLVKSS